MTQAETVTELTPYLEYWSSGIYMFKCPGCNYLHPFHVKEGHIIMVVSGILMVMSKSPHLHLHYLLMTIIQQTDAICF